MACCRAYARVELMSGTIGADFTFASVLPVPKTSVKGTFKISSTGNRFY
jgi:hypothetical protein